MALDARVANDLGALRSDAAGWVQAAAAADAASALSIESGARADADGALHTELLTVDVARAAEAHAARGALAAEVAAATSAPDERLGPVSRQARANDTVCEENAPAKEARKREAADEATERRTADARGELLLHTRAQRSTAMANPASQARPCSPRPRRATWRCAWG